MALTSIQITAEVDMDSVVETISYTSYEDSIKFIMAIDKEVANTEFTEMLIVSLVNDLKKEFLHTDEQTEFNSLLDSLKFK